MRTMMDAPSDRDYQEQLNPRERDECPVCGEAPCLCLREGEVDKHA
jgi:hypothetical protein